MMLGLSLSISVSVRRFSGGSPPALVPMLSAVSLITNTPTTATPRVTVTF